MKRLATFNNPRVAQAFVDYMAARDISLQMMPEGDGQFALWLADSQHEAEVEAELKAFLSNPSASKYSAASWQVADSRHNQFHYASPSMMTMIKAKAGPVTLSIMLLCCVIYALQLMGFGQALFTQLHFPAFEGQKWQLWRWASHALLHFSITHIVFNLLWWWQLGGDIERRLGSGKLLQIFFISAVLSGVGQFYVEGANFGGLSGVVYALLGYLWVLGVRLPHLGLVLPNGLIGFMLVWLVLGFVIPFMNIANTAQLVGLLSGILLALFDSGKRKYQSS